MAAEFTTPDQTETNFVDNNDDICLTAADLIF